ncbi:hypothetical protein [uncultured Anaerococcus sp.]|uniref:hypothetical protein n=1 Tax=uncultured Anaerococcus sp. TaxID=293428 RepID=UPI0025EDFFB8|nr:hypothetical protein [uncultured Anaerococcus sp.]
MSGLINLIGEYSSRLMILPILALMNVIITVIIHFINNKKIIKFVPSLIIGIVALIIGLYSISIFNTPMGLNIAWIALFLATTSLVGICVCFIIDLYNSIKKNMGTEEINNVREKELETIEQTNFKARRKRNKGK